MLSRPVVLNLWVLTPSEGSNDLYTRVENLISCNNNEPPNELKGQLRLRETLLSGSIHCTCRTAVTNQGIRDSKPSTGKGDNEHSTVPVGTVFQAGIEK